MGGTYTKLIYHLTFSTKERHRLITTEIQSRLYEYMGGIIRGEDGALIAAGGTSDHVHLLVQWRPDVAVSRLLQDVKSHSTAWVHKTFGWDVPFNWQDGYGAFTVSESKATNVERYITGQETHHRRRSFQDEFRTLLEKHKVKYDERYIWL